MSTNKLIAVAAVAASAATSAVARDNLLQNGDFEQSSNANASSSS